MKNKAILTIIILIIIVNFNQIYGYTNISGSQSNISITNSPYRATGNLTTDPGGCTVDDGVVIYFDKGTSFIANSPLTLLGSSSGVPGILFCSWTGYSDWNGLKIGTSNAYLSQIQGLFINHSCGAGITIENTHGIYLNNVWVSENTNNNNGGGIRITDCNNIYIMDCWLDSNYVVQNINNGWNDYNGGGIYLENSSTHISGGNIDNGMAQNGAGIYLNNSDMGIINCWQIWNNEAIDYGGGIYIDPNSALIINNSGIIENIVDNYDGGGIYCEQGASNVTMGPYNYIAGNNAPNGEGGGLKLYQTTGFQSDLDEFEQNTAGNGGGVACNSATGTFTNDGFFYNSAQLGGGIYCYYGDIHFDNNYIWQNISINGGGIYSSNSSPRIKNNNVAFNEAYYDGGGIYGTGYLTQIPIVIEQNIFQGNYADGLNNQGFGGGLYLENLYETGTTNPKIVNNLIADNQAVNQSNGGNGGGIYMYDHVEPILNSNTITNNTSSDEGGGIFSTTSQGTYANNIIYDNISTYTWYPELNSTLWSSGNCPLFYNCDIASCIPGVPNYNISSDPLFYGDPLYHVHSTSPTIDVGNNGYYYTGNYLDLNNRIYNDTIDMCCYEHDNSSWFICMGNVKTSVNEKGINSFNVDIYPNPCTSYTTLYFDKNNSDISIVITDINGKIITHYDAKCSNSVTTFTLDLRNLSSGIYLCKIKYINTSLIKRISKL